jgi:hypothetical protein
MFCYFIYFLIFLVPGAIALLVYRLICKNKKVLCCCDIFPILIYDLLILIINLAGLYLFKHICEFTQLAPYFNCLSFTSKYALLSILVGIILAVIAGIVCLIYSHCNKHKCAIKNNCK